MYSFLYFYILFIHIALLHTLLFRIQNLEMWRLKFNKRFLLQFECVTLTWLIFLNWHEYTIHCHKLGVTNYNHSLWLVSLYYQWKEASNPPKTPFQSEVILIKFKLVVIAFLLLSNLRSYTNTKSQKKVQNTR